MFGNDVKVMQWILNSDSDSLAMFALEGCVKILQTQKGYVCDLRGNDRLSTSFQDITVCERNIKRNNLTAERSEVSF